MIIKELAQSKRPFRKSLRTGARRATKATASACFFASIAIARALVKSPKIILADEPTGNLDSKSGIEILNFFDELHKAGNTLIIVTHEESIARRAKRRVELFDGKIVVDE